MRCPESQVCLGLGVIMVLAVAGTAGAASYPPGVYEDPTWAPGWFKSCTAPKSWADWSFTTDPGTNSGPDNEGWNWVFGRSTPSVSLGSSVQWLPGGGKDTTGSIGITGAGTMEFTIWMDNEEADNLKQVWIQFDVRYGDWSTFNLMALQNCVRLTSPSNNGITGNLIYTQPDSNGWVTVTSEWKIDQEEWEQITFKYENVGSGGMEADDVKMLTQCPEPATLSLLALGGLALLRRRR